MSGPKLRLVDGRPAGRFWVDDVLIDAPLRFYSKLVYVVLARLVRGVEIKVSHLDLARLADLGVSSVQRGLAELETAGWLEVIRTEGLKVENTYRLLGNPALMGQPEPSKIGQPDISDRSARPNADRSARPNRSVSQTDKATSEASTTEEAERSEAEVQHPPTPQGGHKRSQVKGVGVQEASGESLDAQGLLLNGAGFVEAAVEAPTGSARPAGGTHVAAAAPAASKVVLKFEYSETFETYWKALPEKAQACGKKAAFEKWKKALKDGATVDEIMVGLEQWKTSRQWTEGFINHATTWLHQERWKVQPEPAGRNRPAPERINDKFVGAATGMVAL